MPGFMLRLLTILLSLSVPGCSTLQAVPDWRAGPAGQGLRVGDVVRVSVHASEPVELVVTELERDALVGRRVDSDQVTRIPASQIAAVERREPTVLGWAGVFAVGLLLPWAIVSLFVALFVAP